MTIQTRRARRTLPRGMVTLAASLAVAAAGVFPASATAQGSVYEVIVDGHTPENQSAFLAYFPSELSVRPGDTIEFPLWDSGEPHTVTFGTIIDEAIAAVAGGADPESDPAIQKVPRLLTEEPGDANQVAANPCFVAEGDPPADACFDREQPAFDGTQSFYNSGWLGAETGFSVTLADDISPGTYNFICLLHAPDMAGTITVVDDGAEVLAPEAVSEQAVARIDEAAGQISVAIEAAAGNPPDQALAGVLTESVMNGLGIVFVPEDVTVQAGEAVTWTVLGPHTVSFNASEEAIGPRVVAPDGTIHVNAPALMPAGGPGQEPPTGPPDPDAPPVLIDAGEWDGTGFLSSGVILSFPPALAQYRVTFTEPGTYPYNCLIHPDMRGTVTVTS